MRVADFDFELPPELIAQTPTANRDDARLLTVDRRTGATAVRRFAEFPELLEPRDCLVVNDTRVIPARLFGRKRAGGGRVELLLLEELAPGEWTAVVRPGRRVKPGTALDVEGAAGVSVTVMSRAAEIFTVGFATPDVLALLEQCGHLPLPPYIQRADTPADRERYQTVFAAAPGAVAAPTAGLHFTPPILARLERRGVPVLRVTLHVGLGTFQPVTAERVEDHRLHEERFVLTAAAAAAINERRAAGGRVVAVGTTSVRVLESCAAADGRVTARAGRTALFLHPPQQPRAVDALLTNFHLPRSTLLMLVSTFVARERLLAAYRLAVRERYRFFSYGDCMFLA